MWKEGNYALIACEWYKEGSDQSAHSCSVIMMHKLICIDFCHAKFCGQDGQGFQFCRVLQAVLLFIL